MFTDRRGCCARERKAARLLAPIERGRYRRGHIKGNLHVLTAAFRLGRFFDMKAKGNATAAGFNDTEHPH